MRGIKEDLALAIGGVLVAALPIIAGFILSRDFPLNDIGTPSLLLTAAIVGSLSGIRAARISTGWRRWTCVVVASLGIVLSVLYGVATLTLLAFGPW